MRAFAGGGKLMKIYGLCKDKSSLDHFDAVYESNLEVQNRRSFPNIYNGQVLFSCKT